MLMVFPRRDESSKDGVSRAKVTLDSSTSKSTKPSKYMLVMTCMQKRLSELCSVKTPKDLHLHVQLST